MKRTKMGNGVTRDGLFNSIEHLGCENSGVFIFLKVNDNLYREFYDSMELPSLLLELSALFDDNLINKINPDSYISGYMLFKI